MMLQELEKRLLKMEARFQELEQRLPEPAFKKPWRETFGMFSADADFDEALRLGREYREQENRRTS